MKLLPFLRRIQRPTTQGQSRVKIPCSLFTSLRFCNVFMFLKQFCFDSERKKTSFFTAEKILQIFFVYISFCSLPKVACVKNRKLEKRIMNAAK